MDPLLVPWEKPLQHVSTLVRQFLIDFIIITGTDSLGGVQIFYQILLLSIWPDSDANFAENCVLLGIALNSNITELKENQVLSLLFSQQDSLAVIECLWYFCDQAVFTVVLLGFHLVGLILKCVYYRYRLLISHLQSNWVKLSHYQPAGSSGGDNWARKRDKWHRSTQTENSSIRDPPNH